MGTRTSRINALRGFCREFGIAIPVGARTGIEAISRVLADPHTAVPELIRGMARLLTDADNSSGSLPAVRSDWRFDDADSMSARDEYDPTTDTGYTTACASPTAKLSVSFLRLWGSPYRKG